MSSQRTKDNINELKTYFNSVIDWCRAGQDSEKEMQLEWGRLMTPTPSICPPKFLPRSSGFMATRTSTTVWLFEYVSAVFRFEAPGCTGV